jgi:hypothetical protein
VQVPLFLSTFAKAVIEHIPATGTHKGGSGTVSFEWWFHRTRGGHGWDSRLRQLLVDRHHRIMAPPARFGCPYRQARRSHNDPRENVLCEFKFEALEVAQVFQPSDNLGLPIWLKGTLVYEGTGRLDHLELSLEIRDAPPGEERIGLAAPGR